MAGTTAAIAGSGCLPSISLSVWIVDTGRKAGDAGIRPAGIARLASKVSSTTNCIPETAVGATNNQPISWYKYCYICQPPNTKNDQLPIFNSRRALQLSCPFCGRLPTFTGQNPSWASSPPDPSEAATVVNSNPQLQSYYNSLESRIGYRLLLGGTRHFGYWDHDTYWPFPLSRPLRAMEDKLAEVLALPRGDHVLDAGCGVGHVALRMAQTHGLRVSGIDVLDHHLEKARRNIDRSGLPKGTITVWKMDYHHLESLADQSLDGIYTMETFVHATDPESVLAGFRRLLRPGGRVALFEYDHEMATDAVPKDLVTNFRQINQYGASPTFGRSRRGVFKRMLEDAGFEDVVVRDFSQNVRPMVRLFWVLAITPYILVRLLGLERYFSRRPGGVAFY